MGIKTPLFFIVIGICVEGMCQRPTPNVITGGNQNKKDVPWPSVGEYRKKSQPPRATYTPPATQPTGSTFYERAYARVLRNYIRHAPNCAAHRRQYYPSYGRPTYVRR